MERMPLQASPQIEPCAGEFEGRGAAPQWGGWGADPPDPDFPHQQPNPKH